MKSSSIIRIPRNWKSKASHALPADWQCPIGQQLTAAELTLRDDAAFRLISRDDEALAIRLALIDQAQCSLDMQYYKWLDDNSGSLLMSHVIAAAERGVRVRLLIDDIHFDADLNAQALDHHPNIEIRLFNPFNSRRMTPLTRPLEWLRNERVNHRMHNKLILVDSLVALCGGRNISDQYFGLSSQVTFRDLDLLCLGNVIPAMHLAFDDFWNSRWAIPVNSLLKISLPARQRRRLQLMLRRFKRSRQYGHVARLQELAKLPVAAITQNLIRAQATVIYDSPDKVQQGPNQPRYSVDPLLAALRRVKQEIHLISPYLIPTPGMLALMQQYQERGVKVNILTNSLASNDVVMAHGGYMAHRSRLLQLGAKLFELSPSAQFDPPAPSPYSLHSKTLVLDQQHVFIGTHNADPRSIHLNTEMGLLIYSQPLAQQVLEQFHQHTQSGNSWRVSRRRGKLFWRRRWCGQTQLKRQEPESSCWRRWLARFSSWLPIHKQL
ncbi:phospholipase D family protein [Neiella marina]|uniref:Phospholipase D family protein n=1 Tax=Neiella holothuriorum TaxID=2870530 RepID=A0ABS7EFL8_9GAMM|nr:phospholipase D family protein [Neiella holothuriorum]MBW8191151.1 phospholipase D family protein [Neiella holothuriorum]